MLERTDAKEAPEPIVFVLTYPLHYELKINVISNVK
jgi:hypothetical protein